MAQLTVRNVPDAVVKALKQRAVENGRSAEAEHRRILEEALAGAAEALDAVIADAPVVSLDDDTIFERDQRPGRPIEFP